MGPCFSLSDAIVYDTLESKHHGLWGQQRLFGTIAWGTFAGLTGLLLDVFQTYTIPLLIFGTLTFADALVAFIWLPKHDSHSNDSKQELPYWKAIGKVMKNPVFIIICLVATTSGWLIGSMQVLSATLLHDLEAPKILFGVVQIVICCFEIPCLFFAGIMIEKIGQINAFLLMYIAYAVRFGVYSALSHDSVWFILPVESLHLFCFGLFFAAASQTVAAIAPPGTSSTFQGVLGTCFLGIGMGTGLLISPNLYRYIGPKQTFFTIAILSIFFCCLLFIVNLLYLRKHLKKISDKSDEGLDGEKSVPMLDVPVDESAEL